MILSGLGWGTDPGHHEHRIQRSQGRVLGTAPLGEVILRPYEERETHVWPEREEKAKMEAGIFLKNKQEETQGNMKAIENVGP